MAEKPDRDTPREESTDEVPPGAESTGEASTGEKPHRRLPTWLALVIEFFTMSRTTLILLIVFLLTAALYGVVRQDPFVAINPSGHDPVRDHRHRPHRHRRHDLR